MNVLSIGTDRSIFDEDSPVRERLLDQASLLSELHVVVFTPTGEKFKKFSLGKHITIYPTSSSGKFAYLSDAYHIGKQILKDIHGVEKGKTKWLVSTQDPFEVGAIGYMLASRFRIPLHLQIHTDPFSDKWKGERFTNRLRFLLALFLLHRAESIRVVSERVFRSVVALGIPALRITKVPIFVDVPHFINAKPTLDLHRSYPEFPQVILSIGRLQPEKNFHGLIRAFAKVRKSHEDALLIIVGSGPERERLLSLAHSLDLNRSFVILPWARDVASYYKTSDIYVQPSLYEGWGLAVIEAMASGTPIVMTDVGCAGEIVRTEETGLVVKPGNEAELLFALNRLLSDNRLRLQLSGNGVKEAGTLATKAETLMLYKESWDKALENSK